MLVVLHGVGWSDLTSPAVFALPWFFNSGAVGLMNAPKARPGQPDPAAPFLTLGAGRPASEPAAPLRLEVAAGRVCQVRGLEAARRSNNLNGVVPGLLGETLRRAHRTVAVGAFGPEPPTAGAAAIGMDASGRVGHWRVWWVLFDEPRPPAPDLRIIEVTAKLGVLNDLANCLRADLDFSRDLLIIAAATTPPYREANRRVMAPVVVVGPGFRRGLLTSASTRRAGIVSNTDIAPTLLRFFGLSVPEAMSGQAMRSIRSRDPAAAITRLDRTTSMKFGLVPPLVYLQSLWQVIALAIAATVLAFGRRSGRWTRALAATVVLIALTLNIGLLLQPMAHSSRPLPAGLVVFGWAALAVWIVRPIRRAPLRVGALCAATAGALLAATLLGSSLLWRSALGLEFMVGSRFYGIGNEWMIILVAAAAVAGGAAADLWGRRLPWQIACWLVIVFIMGAPTLGANWGGCLTAAATGLALVLGLARPVRWWHVAAGLGGAAVAVIAVLLTNLAASSPTHITRSAYLVARHGLGALAGPAGHRLAAILMPLGYEPLLVVAAPLMAAALVTVIRPWGPFSAALRAHAGLRAGLLAAALGGFAAALVNDSGVVLLAAAWTVVGPALIYVGLEERDAEARAGA